MMMDANSAIARELANVASRFQLQRTGHVPTAATVVLSDDTLVVTLHDALTPAEKDLSRTAEGAAKVQEYHRELFTNSTEAMRLEIKRLTGRDVREAIVEIEPATGAVVHVFTSGTMVQVFLLSNGALKPPSSEELAQKRADDDGFRLNPKDDTSSRSD
jgi:uncharacterized protein YbcI